MLQLGSYLEYHFVEHIPMPLLAHLWFVFLAVNLITPLYAICKEKTLMCINLIILSLCFKKYVRFFFSRLKMTLLCHRFMPTFTYEAILCLINSVICRALMRS